MKQTFTTEEQEFLRSLVQHPGWPVYQSILESVIEDHTTKVLTGDLPYEEYKARTEAIRALQYALKRPHEIIRQRPQGASDA